LEVIGYLVIPGRKDQVLRKGERCAGETGGEKDDEGGEGGERIYQKKLSDKKHKQSRGWPSAA